MHAARKGKLVVLSAPAGTGKTTVAQRLIEEGIAIRSVSDTTRAPRGAEQNGVDYNFINEAEFLARIARGYYLEHADVFGRHYGTPLEPIRSAIKQGRVVLLVIDVQGGEQVKQRMGSDAVLVFLQPPSMEELRRRLESRATDRREEIEKRLQVAQSEMKYAPRYDYRVVNDRLDRAVEEVRGIIEKETTQ